MRVTLSVAALLGALTLALPAIAAPVIVPAGTPVTVRLVNPVTSGSAKLGERFAFQAAAPVV
ncbi:MAG: hypothetical protein M3R44_02550, partial [Candidatus Eremiobacteraeota bacterium]|nr:hypothetical protein [Candidatus Eremiobacteraeota bacterium]